MRGPRAVRSAGVHLVQDRPLPWGWRDVPMLFRPNMVGRILPGEKTETRRLKGLERMNRRPDFVHLLAVDDVPKKGVVATFRSTWSGRHYWAKCPYGRPGDRIWVREKWYHEKGKDFENAAFDGGMMKAKEGSVCTLALGWEPTDRKIWRPRPSIHMPRWAARILLRIHEIRVERLSLLTEAGAIAEGVKEFQYPLDHGYGLPGPDAPKAMRRAKDYFLGQIWDRIHAGDGMGSARDPWVWVVKFQPCQDDGIPRPCQK